MRSTAERWLHVAIRASARSALLVLFLATCRDSIAPSPKTPVYLAQRITCSANHTAKSVTCVSGSSGIGDSRAQAIAKAQRGASLPAAPGMSAAILGGQGIYVELTSSNVIADVTNFNFDAAVRNLTPQPMATADGINPDGIGVNVFFDVEPAAPVTIAGDQCCIFGTRPNQDYFGYIPGGILAANDSTFPQNWEFDYNGPAVDFTFVVYVSTRLPNDPALVVIPPHEFIQIATGVTHACGVRSGNVAYCWGDNNNGEAGIGVFSATPNLEPVGSIGNVAFTQVATGQFFSCGLDTSNAAYCWGAGDSATLGNGDAGDNVPTPVGGVEHYKQISAFANTVCAVEVGASDQQVQCWGSNEHGQAGIGSAGTLINTPTNVTVGGGTFSSVSVGATHTCALKATGVAWCWGANDAGQVGNGTHGADVPNPPAAVNGSHTFIAVAAGNIFSCGIDASNKGWCWGDGTFGQLGNGFFSSQSDSPAAMSMIATFTTVTAGWFHACAIEVAAAHRAFCWGANDQGEIGNGNTTDVNKATAVTPTSGFGSIAAGFNTTCAVTTANIPYCWGEGDNGQIGNGTMNLANKNPVAVALP